MFDPGDNCSGRTGRSWVGEPTTATLTLPYLPQELILRIASLLEVRDLLALRMVGFNLDKLKPPKTYQLQTEPQIHIQPNSRQTPLEGLTSRPPATTTTGSEVPLPTWSFLPRTRESCVTLLRGRAPVAQVAWTRLDASRKRSPPPPGLFGRSMGHIHSGTGSTYHLGYPRESPKVMGDDVVRFPGRDLGRYSRRGPS